MIPEHELKKIQEDAKRSLKNFKEEAKKMQKKRKLLEKSLDKLSKARIEKEELDAFTEENERLASEVTEENERLASEVTALGGGSVAGGRIATPTTKDKAKRSLESRWKRFVKTIDDSGATADQKKKIKRAHISLLKFVLDFGSGPVTEALRELFQEKKFST